jgi:hypothetical protein
MRGAGNGLRDVFAKSNRPLNAGWFGRSATKPTSRGERLAGSPPLRQIRPLLPDEQTTPEQFEILRRMTPGRRLEIAEGMYWSARRMKSDWLKSLHPEWAEEQVNREVSRIFLNAAGPD